MNTAPARLARMTVGDLRERMRRPAYAVVVLASIGLAALAVPDPRSRWSIITVSGYRGLYDSAYVGTVTAVASALWISLAGFYVIRTSIARDERSRVGQLLAATPLPTRTYLLAKFAGNLGVLLSMLAVVALSAAVLQLLRGESSHLDVGRLLLPYLALPLPLLTLTAAAGVVFEATPVLRTSLGNATWIALVLGVAAAGGSSTAPLGGTGFGAIVASLQAGMAAAGVNHADQRDVVIGLAHLPAPLRTFAWAGWSPGEGFLLSRLALGVLGVLLVLVPTLWFTRFDPSRTRARRLRPRAPGTGAMAQPVTAAAAPVAARAGTVRAPSAAVEHGNTAWRLVVGELRILIQGLTPWWWLGALAIAVVVLALPQAQVPRGLLVAWVWPVLVWSRLGAQQGENDLEGLMASYPWPRSRFLAQWAAGIVFTLVTGLAPAVRMLMAGDGAGLAAWVAGAVFIPSLALGLGRLSRTQRLFQALYLLLWYLMVNGSAALDIMGAVRTDGHLDGPRPVIVLAVGVVVLMLSTILVAGRSGAGALAIRSPTSHRRPRPPQRVG
ncbi:hypothetical protein ACFQ46_22425 [Kineococcus sp. GCM10028916]|uniref:hypothetical protein n=1 Tax=Kineococcus sp. GCM10028916 TaxID=3273394 RepID=UPI00363112A9